MNDKIMVFPAEIEAGLSDKILQNRLSFAAKLVQRPNLCDTELQSAIACHLNDVASAGLSNSIDLYPLSSILVTTGWNRNDDVFDRTEMWQARHTPVNKKVDFQHDEDDIIGHIVAAKAVDADGQDVPDDTPVFSLPAKFHLLASAVIYKAWEDREKVSRVKSLIQEIENDEWYVSMECIFFGFDYALKKDDEQKVIIRSDATAGLSRYLRCFGGSGLYEGYQIGRLFRDIVFIGKGLVKQPGNPESVILNDETSIFKSENIFEEDIIMAEKANDSLQAQVDELTGKLTEANTSIATLIQERDGAKAQVETLTGDLAKANEKVAELDQQLGTSKAEVTELTAKATKLVEVEAALASMRLEETKRVRCAKLVKAGFKDEQTAMAKVEKFIELNDEKFEEVVALACECQTLVPPVAEVEKVEEVEAVAPVEPAAVTPPVEASLENVEETEQEPALATAGDLGAEKNINIVNGLSAFLQTSYLTKKKTRK